MSKDPSPYMSWHGLILSLKRETESERRYVEGILHALWRVVERPELAALTAEQLEWLEQLWDRKTGATAEEADNA